MAVDNDGDILVCAFCNKRINTILETFQSLCNRSVQYDHCLCTVGFASYGTEFKTVTGEGER